MADGGIVINTGTAPPERETSFSEEQRRKSAASVAAGQAVKDANAEVIASRDAAAPVEDREALIRQYGAGEHELLAIQGANRQAEIEADRARAIADFREQDRQQIEQVAKAAKKKNEARVNFWEGNTAGKIFAAFLRGIDRAASSFRGESGPTGTDRLIDAKIDAHERMLIGEWEQEEKVRALKKADHEAYLSELERKKIEATNHSKAELEAMNARVEKYLQGLAPEKAAVARQQWQADYMAASARLDQKSEEGYDKVIRNAETRRMGGPGQTPAVAVDSKGNQVPVASEAEARDAASSKSQLDAVAERAQAAIKAVQDAGEGTLGTVPWMGEGRRGIDGALESLATAIASRKGDSSPAAIRAEKARFWPSRGTKPTELVGDLQRVLAEETSAHDARVKAAARAPAATSQPAAPGAGAAPKPAGDGVETRTLKDGTKVRVRKRSDGKWEEVR